MTIPTSRLHAFVLAALLSPAAAAQTGPVNGMRPADLRVHAITNATVITAPGEKLDRATIIIRDGVIEAVGPNVAVPPEARTWDADGLTIYPGLIEPALLIKPADLPVGPGAHWNSRVHSQVSMATQPGPTRAQRKDLRALGFTTAAVYPATGLMRGSGIVIALADEDRFALTYRDPAAMAVGFDYGGTWERAIYPGSLMGAMALFRQTIFDAQWHAECRRVWRDHPDGNEPPIRADALEALADVVAGRQSILFEVDDELNALRAAKLAKELELHVVLLGSGLEFRRLDQIAATGLPIILPLKFPDTPKVASLIEADRVSLRDMMTWEQAPTNPRRLAESGVTIALTTYRLKKTTDFPAALREAIRHGLSEDAALAALTTAPAKLLGLDSQLGTIAPGKAANLVVVEGSLFVKKPRVRETWINGRRYPVMPEPKFRFKGEYLLRMPGRPDMPIAIDTEKKTLSITPGPGEGSAIKARDVTVQQERISFVVDGKLLSAPGSPGAPGFVRFTGVIGEGVISGDGAMPDGSRFTFSIEPDPAHPPRPFNELANPQAGPDAAPADDEKPDDDHKAGKGDEDEKEEPLEMPAQELNHPLGEYGLASPPRQQDVLIENATIWTSAAQGVFEQGVMLVSGGVIRFIGTREQWQKLPASARTAQEYTVIDAAGKHVTPGLIDCHSHTGISGSVNEWAQTNTAEVAVGDVIDPDDIDWYRELAGGTVAVNQLHGSANPIGGQTSVVKIKWSGGPGDFPIAGAKPGIKFALGENVTRPDNRYPKTRMGVETFMRDALLAAREYREKWQRYLALSAEERARTMPPQPDLELDTLAQILTGERLIHCHSYRQDEILMLIRLADDFGFKIGTFQHVLEGYKVAEAIARHGAGASSFSDWWAYKIEVMDAIPDNGAIMHDLGVLVSFNSDSDELARRLNTEAAKAVRYGGLAPDEALKFVTINPAQQLRIDQRTGSLEAGKDADFVVWSGDPLSTFTRCEQTWIEGARYFDLDTDKQLREQARTERERLTQKILARTKPKRGSSSSDEKSTDESGEYKPPQARSALIQAHVRWMAEQVARGRDPDENLPGECGCDDGWWWWTTLEQAEEGQ